jgi:vacuolar-type H+-ATPase subunit B/Vma2
MLESLLIEKETMKDHITLEEKLIKAQEEINSLKRVIKIVQGRYCSEMDEYAVKCFLRTRTFIIMKALNKRAAAEALKRGTSDDSKRRTFKKMKKIVG